MSIFLRIILWGAIVCAGVLGGIQLISFIDAYFGNREGVRLHFNEFLRIYELAPTEWERKGDTFRRRKLSSRLEDGSYGWNYIETTILMKTFWDYILLRIWMEKKEVEKARKENHEKKVKNLNDLKYFVDSDAEEIRKKLEKFYKEAEELQDRVIKDLED